MGADWTCLMYHGITDGRVVASGGREHFSVPLEAFESQLDWIRSRGYEGRSIQHALEQTGEKRIAISFDDGDLGQYELAFPALLERGMTATFLVPTAWVGRPGFVTWAQLREMKAAGMSVESHTRSHPFLSELDETQLVEELAESKVELDRRLEQSTTQLALPGGDWPRRSLRGRLRQVGYGVIATSQWGVNPDRPVQRDGITYVRRCTVRGTPSCEAFVQILAGHRWTTYRRWVRDGVLRSVRWSLGPTRYQRWRRWVLGTVSRNRAPGRLR